MNTTLGRGWFRWVLFGLVAAYVALPVVAAALYSVSTAWTGNDGRVLPDGYTPHWWAGLVSDQRLIAAIGRSLLVAGLAVLIVAALVLPPLYWSYVRNPKLRTLMSTVALIPFALPFVVMAFGIKDITAHLPLVSPRLHEAAQVSGANAATTLFRVVIPNIRTGILTGSILVFAISFGEYSIARVITGTSFETVPVWQVQLTPVNGGGNPNGVAVMSVLTFVLFFAVSLFAALSRDRAGGDQTAPQTLPGATTTASTQGGR